MFVNEWFRSFYFCFRFVAGDRNTSSVLETLCDTPNIESVFSTGHTMHAHFKSSMEEQVQGFILEYSQVDDSKQWKCRVFRKSPNL